MDGLLQHKTQSVLGNDFIKHYGVLGMHWGVTTQKVASDHSEDAKVARELRKQPISSLSNEELKKLNARQKLEQEHTRLNPKTHDKGLKAVKTIIGGAGMAAGVYNLAKGPAGAAALKLGARMVLYGFKLAGK